MNQEQWTAVDKYIAETLVAPDAALEAALKANAEAELPAIDVAPNQGKFLHVLALARGARIYGEVAGYASTCEAYHRVRLEECGEEPARTMQMAMTEAGVDAEQVGYINYHGTATDLNDRIETRATRLAFGKYAERIPGSSLKSLIGHPQGACGAAGMAATLLAMRDGLAPPTLNLEDPDPECDLDYIPNEARPIDCEYALVNCIAFGSKNSALVLRKG